MRPSDNPRALCNMSFMQHHASLISVLSLCMCVIVCSFSYIIWISDHFPRGFSLLFNLNFPFCSVILRRFYSLTAFTEKIQINKLIRIKINTWTSVSSKHLTAGSTDFPKVKMFTKWLIPTVSSIVFITIFAISSFCPFIEPELSTRMMISSGLVAASRYHERSRQSYKSTGLAFHLAAGNWRMKPVELP